MTHDRDYYLSCAHEMEKSGGGFASAIAQAFYKADEHNMTKLLASFGSLFEKFAPKENEQ